MQIRDSLAALMRDSRLHSETLSDVRERLAKLEANDARLAHLEADMIGVKATVGLLVTDKTLRQGRTDALTWLFKNWPGVCALIAAVATVSVVVLKANGKL